MSSSVRHVVAWFLATLGVLSAGLVVPSIASAAGVSVSGSTLTFQAAGGEANDLTVERSTSAYRVTDGGATLTAGAGCTQVDDQQATCPLGTISTIRGMLGDGDDTAVVSGPTRSHLYGEEGKDRLTGGWGPDRLDAGAGSGDVLRGEAGPDILTASGATGAVELAGGSGHDTLTGNGTGDEVSDESSGGFGRFSTHALFVGGTGNDRITGSYLNDAIDGGPGADTISGGAGGSMDFVFYGRRTEALTVNIADTAASDGGSSDAGVVNGVSRRDQLLRVEGVLGGSGADSMTGSAGPDLLLGGNGDDSLAGGGGNDALCGGGSGSLDFDSAVTSGYTQCPSLDPHYYGGTSNGADTLSGGDGDDQLVGGTGADALSGGLHVDTVDYGDRTGAQAVTIADNCRTSTGALYTCARDNDGLIDADLTVAGNQSEGDKVGLDVENLIGGLGTDTLSGDADANRLDGSAGTDTLTGGAGDDALCGDGGAFYRRAPHSAGYCHEVTSGRWPNTLNGGDGDDILAGGRAADALNGGTGVDTATWQGRQKNTITTIADTCRTSTGATYACAGNNDGEADVDPSTYGDQPERDRVGLDVENLIGGDGNDVLSGSASSNLLLGDQGTDTLSGLAGDDTLEPNSGAGDRVNGGTGFDYASYRDEGYAVTVTLNGAADDGNRSGTPSQNVGTDVEGVLGTRYGDTLTGQSTTVDNTLDGYGGNDRLTGNSGNDRLIGGTGSDDLWGGVGDDELSAADRFSDPTLNCGDGTDSVLFDEGMETPTACETLQPVGTAATSASVADPFGAASREMERALAR